MKNTLGSKSKRHLGSRAFLVAGFIFFCGMLIQTLNQEFTRELPASPQDYYAYILKGLQVLECPLQDCPALVDLDIQTAFETSNEAVVDSQANANDRLMGFVYPFHSLLLAALIEIGATGKTALFISKLIANALLAIGYALLIKELVGEKSATLSLLFLSITVYPMRGLHQMGPDHLSLALGLFFWLMMIRNKEFSKWKLGMLSIFIIGFHPLGLVVVAAGIGLFASRAFLERTFDKEKAKIALFLISLVIAGFIFPYLIDRPQFYFNAPTSQLDEYSIGNRLILNSRIFLDFIAVWRAGFFSALLQLALFAYGLYKLSDRQKVIVGASGAVLCGLFFMSLFYVEPPHGHTLMPRLWVPLAIFITAVSSRGIVEFVDLIRSNWARSNSQLGSNHFVRATAFVALVLIGLQITQHFIYYADLYKRELVHLRTYNDLHYEVSQLDIVEREINPGERIAYGDLTSMLYWLSNGALEHNAVLLTAVMETEQEDDWLKDLRFFWARQPYRNMSNFFQDSLLVEDDLEVVLDFSASYEDLDILIQNPGSSGTLHITNYAPVKETLTIDIPEGFSDWIRVRFPGSQMSRLGIRSIKDDGDGSLLFKGVRTFGRQETRWPWGDGLEISLFLEGEEEAKSSVLIDRVLEMGGFEFDVVHDGGYSILLEAKEIESQ